MTPVIKLSKRIEFRYSRRDKEIIVDRDGRFPNYSAGDLVERRGKTWKAVEVNPPTAQSRPAHSAGPRCDPDGSILGFGSTVRGAALLTIQPIHPNECDIVWDV